MDEEERWAPFDDAYEISDLGNARRSKPGRRTMPGRMMRPILQKIGYLSVRPVVDGVNVHRYVHHLVAAAFIGPRPDGFDINHIDGNKTNNSASNLEYVSHADNMAHAARTGLMRSGERHPGAKLSDAQALNIVNRRAAGERLCDIAEEFGIAKSTASQIANGIRRKS